MLGNGKYKVAFNTDEENYDETGTYALHNNENTIEWLSGMFKNNNWGGKLVKKENGYGIEFSKNHFLETGSKKSFLMCCAIENSVCNSQSLHLWRHFLSLFKAQLCYADSIPANRLLLF